MLFFMRCLGHALARDFDLELVYLVKTTKIGPLHPFNWLV